MQEGGQEETVVEDAQLQVSVLITMPSPYRPHAWDADSYASLGGKARRASGSGSAITHDHEEEEDLPEVMLGVAEVPWRVRVPKPASEQ